MLAFLIGSALYLYFFAVLLSYLPTWVAIPIAVIAAVVISAVEVRFDAHK